MSEAWSAQQHEWLQAMGLQAFALAGSEPTVAEAPVAGPRPSVSDAPPARAVGSAPPATPRDAAGGQPPLLRALLKAARRDAADAEFVRAVPDVDSLRGNAAAKRAAWPRLRALRRAPRP